MESTESNRTSERCDNRQLYCQPTKRLRDQHVGSGLSSVLATQEEVELRSARAVRYTDGGGKLDTGISRQTRQHVLLRGFLQVSGGDVVPLDEGALLVDDLVDTQVGVEVRLDVLKDCNRAVRAAATVLWSV